MKVAVWRTQHEIADTVALAIAYGLEAPIYRTEAIGCFVDTDVHFAYGILRGTDEVFHKATNWFNVDRGYFNPGHFDGYYRISYKGTQAKWHDGIPQADRHGELEDWRSGELGSILIVPPTQHVIDFLGLPPQNDWIAQEGYKIFNAGYRGDMWVKHKDDDRKIDWNYVKGVITFNSSIGWQALQRGIPVISDPEHSIVGSYYKHELDKKGLDYNFDNVKLIPREPLFKAMFAHQFTLKEIREGKAWGLINHYISSSAMTAGNR